jgi:hypothetical protein
MSMASAKVTVNVKLTPQNARMVRLPGNENLVDVVLTKFFAFNNDVMGVIADDAITSQIDACNTEPPETDTWLDDTPEYVPAAVSPENAAVLEKHDYLFNELLTGIRYRNEPWDTEGLEETLKEAEEDIRAGRTYKHEDVMRWAREGIPLPELPDKKAAEPHE